MVLVAAAAEEQPDNDHNADAEASATSTAVAAARFHVCLRLHDVSPFLCNQEPIKPRQSILSPSLVIGRFTE
jgi:hypothetical protein